VRTSRARIQERVSEQMIGTQASVSMSDLRTIRVFVVGEVEQPGSYTVGGLAAISNALLASGGVKPIGSLRDIQLKRNGRLLTRLDLYDLLLNGDASNDARLQTGDVIFIPPVGLTVGISGEVRRPAIYELKGESTAGELVRLAGGFTPDADPALTRLERGGWLDAEWRQTANSRRARYYTLTRAGRKQLDAQTADWTRRASAVARILKTEA